MKIPDLRRFTSARVALGRAGHSIPAREFLKLRLAEVYAREAVHSSLDVLRLEQELAAFQKDILVVQSLAPDRSSYVRRPDWGRCLNEDSRQLLQSRRGCYDVALAISDGLSANAIHLHARAFLTAVFSNLFAEEDWKIAPLVIVQQGRVAIGDEIGELLGASLSVVLIGERPGLSAADSLGVYLTWHPCKGLTDADRNCLSNIRDKGLDYAVAAHRLAFLMREARRLKLSGVGLKEEANLLDRSKMKSVSR